MAPLPDNPESDTATLFGNIPSLLIQISTILPLLLYPLRPASTDHKEDGKFLLAAPAGINLIFVHATNLIPWIISWFIYEFTYQEVWPQWFFQPPPWTWALSIFTIAIAMHPDVFTGDEIARFCEVMLGFQIFWYILDFRSPQRWAFFMGCIAALVCGLAFYGGHDLLKSKIELLTTERVRVNEEWSEDGEKNEREKKVLGYRVLTIGLVAITVVAAFWAV